MDHVEAELIKHGPEKTRRYIQGNGKHRRSPTEIQDGILIPLPEPGKPKRPVENLRPALLLTTLRKLLAICMINRTAEKVKT